MKSFPYSLLFILTKSAITEGTPGLIEVPVINISSLYDLSSLGVSEIHIIGHYDHNGQVLAPAEFLCSQEPQADSVAPEDNLLCDPQSDSVAPEDWIGLIANYLPERTCEH